MTVQTAEISADLPCHRCGYDLRVHPHDGVCPECGASVAESRRVAAIPRRPAWRDSDPRWRRRMVAGAGGLVLLPLMDVMSVTGWAQPARADDHRRAGQLPYLGRRAGLLAGGVSDAGLL